LYFSGVESDFACRRKGVDATKPIMRPSEVARDPADNVGSMVSKSELATTGVLDGKMPHS
jgi:hypothetical protein